MAVTTNKPEAFTRPLLEMTALAEFFSVVVSGDNLPRHKPDPMPLVWTCGRLGISPADALFIGDSVNDFLAARAAGCRVFLLPYGYNEGRDVQELECDAIVSTIDSAAQLIGCPSQPEHKTPDT
jgi:phosphoglycolate phosphatase